MAYPAGIALTTVTVGSASGFFGEDAEITVSVVPVLGGNARHIVHQETGHQLLAFSETFKGVAGEPVTFKVPPVDQPGFIDGSGNAVTMWSYLMTQTVRKKGVNYVLKKAFQVLSSQTGPVDLDKIPDGSITEPSSAPLPSVLSVNGQTGDVEIEGATDTGVATQIQSGTATLAALDASTAALLDDSASDLSTKVNATTASTVGPMVPPLVADALAADDTPAQAAAVAVNAKVAGLDLVQSSDPGAPRVFQGDGVLLGFTDARGVASFLMADKSDGGPTPFASDLIASRMTYARLPTATKESLTLEALDRAGIRVITRDGVLLGFTDSNYRSTWLTARTEDGGPTDFWMDHLSSRLALPDNSISEAKLDDELRQIVNEPSRYREDLVEVEGVTPNRTLALTDGVTGQRTVLPVGGDPRDARTTADRHVIFTNNSGLRHIEVGGTKDHPVFPEWNWSAMGDSLTKAGGPNTLPPEQAYPVVLQGLLQQVRPGVQVHMGGIASQTAGEIAVRQGGIVLSLMPVGGSIPASGAVEVTYTPVIDHRVALAVFNVPGVVNGVHGTVSKVVNSSTFTFTRTTAGAAVPFMTPMPFTADEAEANKYRGQLLWPGRNNVGFNNHPAGSGTVVEAVLRSADAMVSTIPVYAPRFIIMGTTNAWSEGVGSSQHADVVAINDELKRRYGNIHEGGNYWDVRSYLIHEAMEDAGLAPTADDLAKIAADAPPPSLMADSVHFNAIAYDLIAHRLFDLITLKGWV